METTPSKNIVQSVESIRSNFTAGSGHDISTRINALKTLKAAIINHTDELYKALHTDLHKSHSESFITEISIVLNEIDDHLRHIKRWSRSRHVPTPLTIMPARSRILPEPLGVVLIIAPWNYPFQLLIAPLIGAISAGNSVVLKASEYVPNVNHVINKIIIESFQPNYVTLIEGGHQQNQTLLSQRFDHIFFTGSPALGRVVMEAAAQNLTPVTLELGGKSPCIVDRGAKLDFAARRVIWGKLLNAGQTCIAPDYLYVHSSVHDEFIKLMVRYIKHFFGNDPRLSKDYPRIINDRAFDRLEQAMHSSGSVIYGGETDREQRYIAPTLIVEPRDDTPLMTDEIFGPLLPIKSFDEIGEVISFINNRPKPLALYYFGPSKTAHQVLSQTSSGGACINDTIMHIANHNLPFGGVGNSGMGRYHSRASFELFSNTRSVVWSSTMIDVPFRYAPYLSIKWLKRLI